MDSVEDHFDFVLTTGNNVRLVKNNFFYKIFTRPSEHTIFYT